MEPKHSILIVDDNPINIKVLMDSLGKPEYRLLSATNGQKALMIAEKVIPDLILLDINMPGLNGYDTCKKLKENEQTKGIPVIFLSALNEVGNKIHGFNVGAVDYITKPFQRDEILVRVRTQIKISELHKKSLKQKEEISSILHILSHDILNQIMLIDVSATLLDGEIQTTPETEKRLGVIQSTVQNIAELISKINTITRLEEGKYEFESAPLSTKRIRAEVEKVFSHRATEKNISFEFEMNDIEDFIHVDHVIFFNTILNNIISNAIKFSFPDSKIKISAIKNDECSVLRVQDFGTGMTEEQLANVFRTDRNTTTTGTQGERGTGYGMPLIKRYTEAQKGQIKIESSHIEVSPNEHGTTIELSFKHA